MTLQAGMTVRLSESARRSDPNEFDPYARLWGREDGHVVIVEERGGELLAGVSWRGWSRTWNWFKASELEVVG